MKTLRNLIILVAAILFAACSSTKITETAYDDKGAITAVKVTETTDSPIVVGIANTKDKHVVAHIGGWYANVGVQPNSNSYGIGVGTIDNTYSSIVAADKNGKDVAAVFPAIVDASKYSLTVTKDGIESKPTNDNNAATQPQEKKE